MCILFQVKKTFRTSNWWEHHETWRDMRYDWLPSWNQIPKHLHEKTSRSHLEQLQVKYHKYLGYVKYIPVVGMGGFFELCIGSGSRKLLNRPFSQNCPKTSAADVWCQLWQLCTEIKTLLSASGLGVVTVSNRIV